MRRPGTDAEDRAADYLLSQGYSLLTRRYKATQGEIDVVAMDGDELVFIEVKERRSRSPEESIGNRKIERLQLAANQFRRTLEVWDKPFRFDVIAIQGGELRHHRDVLVHPVIEELDRPEDAHD